ncbi:mitotic checkpoint serine/threonine-protein kinase BUB1 beta isoform X2 [Dendropsophus ebraccatus]|uniref:mitotic checkpoint serine/threonine-protein kinase BUB1 beta isoform X2 n=1 Tax=Dendropsophus ebraccatus TaxID=150705 RepID=UPI003831AFC1
MAQGGDEWELCKENVQPLRQGRVMATLQEVLSQQDSAHHHAIQQQKQAFELELRFYTGDDPLDVWDRYIKWAEQAFPQGGKDSNLAPLLERAVKIFHQEPKYYTDLRYLTICLKFAHFCTEPLDLYSYLHSQGIGILQAQLYITWAEEYEARGNHKKADSIFQDGIQCRAEPLEKLETHHKQFQARVLRQVIQGVNEGADTEESEMAEPQRSSLVDLKTKGKNKVRAPVNRVGDAVKSRSLGPLSAPPQQIPSRSGFAVFDENSGVSGVGGMAPPAVQPWAALPPARAKENEQKAGPWNSGRQSRSSRQSASSEPPQSVPSFTPYVDETAEQQTVTPCKINPSVSNVLSSRKPGKEEDPLQRLQSHSEGKEEMVMYCKNKVYAGVAEFSLEEIRAEIYMAKIRKKREEELQASALRRLEMERQIEEMEKKLKGKCVTTQGPEDNQPEDSCVLRRQSSEVVEGGSVESMVTASTVQSMEVLSGVQENVGAMGSSPALSSNVPFTIFDETCEAQPDIDAKNSMPPPKRRPLASVSRALVKTDAPLSDTLDDIEHLSEDAIVTGSNGNKTLFTDTEDTCDFMRAAHLASTPFQKTKDELQQGGLERMPLREKTPVCEKSYRQVVCPKELSPILEASQEDTRSSVSSVSSISASSSCLLASKTLIIKDNLDLVSQMSGVYEQALGTETYQLKGEVVLGDNNRIYMGAQADCEMENEKGVALKVDLKPLPWDFYIVQQLKERLGEAFESHFVDQCECYLYQDGCITLYREICPFTIQDILQDPEELASQVIILFAYNLLSLVEKLHTAEMVHGDLRPETLLLDAGIFTLASCTEMNNCVKLVDFSRSMDMRLCPTLTAKAFPIAQSEHGQQILGAQTSPYQADLLAIADVVHLMIFKKHLQIQQKDSSWEITQKFTGLCNESLWNTFFSKILNASHGSTTDVLKEAKDKMAELFDSCFLEEVCSYFIQLEMRLHSL